MAFGNFKAFRYSKRGNYIKRKVEPKTVKKLNKKINKVASSVRPETKHVGVKDNMPLPINEVTIADNRRHYFYISRGSGSQDRIGNKIKALGVSWRFVLRATNDSNQNRVHLVRMVFLFDRRSNNADMQLQDYNIGGGPSNHMLDPSSLRNEEFRKRFKVIFDKVIKVGGKTNTANKYDTDYHAEVFVKGGVRFKKPLTIIYNNLVTTGSPQDINQGTFYMLQLDTTSSTVGVALDLEARLYYSDA